MNIQDHCLCLFLVMCRTAYCNMSPLAQWYVVIHIATYLCMSAVMEIGLDSISKQYMPPSAVQLWQIKVQALHAYQTYVKLKAGFRLLETEYQFWTKVPGFACDVLVHLILCMSSGFRCQVITSRCYQGVQWCWLVLPRVIHRFYLVICVQRTLSWCSTVEITCNV